MLFGLVTQRTASLGDIADHVRRPNYLSPNTARFPVHMVSVTPQLFLHKQIVWNIKPVDVMARVRAASSRVLFLSYHLISYCNPRCFE